jgi:hypothetical protein
MFGIIENSRDMISLHGRKGAIWSDITSALTLSVNTSNILYQQLATKGYRFEQIDNDIKVYAPENDIMQSLGIKSCLEMQVDPALLLLELLGFAKQKGLLLNEASSIMNLKHIHQVVDKLVDSKLIIRRTVTPISSTIRGNREARFKHKITIIHLIRFAHLYNPDDDAMVICVEDTDTELYDIQRDIVDILHRHNVTIFPLHALAKELQFEGANSLRKYLTQCFALRPKASNRLVITRESDVAKTKNVYNVELNTAFNAKDKRTSSNMEVEDGPEETSADCDDKNPYVSSSQTARNLPLYEQIVARLANEPAGMISTQIRDVSGLGKRRAYDVVIHLATEFEYPNQKVQEGRQTLRRLFRKGDPDPCSVIYSSSVLRMVENGMEEQKRPRTLESNSESVCNSEQVEFLPKVDNRAPILSMNKIRESVVNKCLIKVLVAKY